MITRGLTLWAIAVAVLASACTLDQASVPALTGPSDFATSLTLTTNPDTLVLNGQQSVVIVQAHRAVRCAAGEPPRASGSRVRWHRVGAAVAFH